MSDTQARKDYSAFLSEVGMTDSEVRAASDQEGDRIDIDTDSIYLADSNIEGIGIFSSNNLRGGDVVMAAVVDGKRTQAGRYSNHSDTPNTRPEYIGDDAYMTAINDIEIGDELTTSYRDVYQLMKSKNLAYSKEEFRDWIFDFEDHVKSKPKDLQIEPTTNHFFADGTYGREMILNAGEYIVGKIHKTRHLVVVSKGNGYVMNEDGLVRYEAPLTFVSEPGTKRAIFAESDTVWLAVIGTHETDLDKIEKHAIAPDYDSLGGK